MFTVRITDVDSNALRVQPFEIALADFSRCIVDYTENGYGSLELRLDRVLGRSLVLYTNMTAYKVEIVSGAYTPFEGRCENPTLEDNSITFNVYGYWIALDDYEYSALWSDTRFNNWKETNQDQIASTRPDKYDMKKEGSRLHFALQKNAAYATSSHFGIFNYRISLASVRQIVGLAVEIVGNMPANWFFLLQRVDQNAVTVTTQINYAFVGASFRRTYIITFAACFGVAIGIYNGTGAIYTNTAEAGENFVNVINIRVVTTTTNMINTTFTAPVASGASVTANVVTTTNMYVGQRLWINSNLVGAFSSGGETVVIEQILSGTQFVATFQNGYSAGETVQAFLVYAHEIAQDIITKVNALNPSQIASTTAEVFRTDRDLIDVDYDDTNTTAILKQLANLGSQLQKYETGVMENQVVYFRPINYTDVIYEVLFSDIELKIDRDLRSMYNSVRAKYQLPDGEIQRTNYSTSTINDQVYGFIKRKTIEVDTTLAVTATSQRDLEVADTRVIAPRATYTLKRVYSTSGIMVPLWCLRVGTVIRIKHLPPLFDDFSEGLIEFTIANITIDMINNGLRVSPTKPIPKLEYLLATR